MYYTDRSGLQDQVGVAAVNLVTGARFKKVCQPFRSTLGLYSQASRDISCLGPGVGRNQKLSHNARFDLYGQPVCNQGSQQPAGKIRTVGKSGQFLIEEILTKARELQLPLAIHWIPAHVGVPGNEWANKEAKAAAQLPISRKNKRLLRREIQKQQLPTLRSGLIRKSKKAAQRRWEQEWDTSKYGTDLYKIQPRICKKSLKK